MKTKNIQIESDRRCSAEDLEKILTGLPIDVKGPTLQLSARMGLGKIVYIEPLDGYVSELGINGSGVVIKNDWSSEYCLGFSYRNQRFELKLKRGG